MPTTLWKGLIRNPSIRERINVFTGSMPKKEKGFQQVPDAEQGRAETLPKDPSEPKCFPGSFSHPADVVDHSLPVHITISPFPYTRRR